MGISAFDDIASRNHGIVTRRAAGTAGVPARTWYRCIERGLLEPVHPGVCRMFGSARTPEQAILAAVLGAGKGALASHRSAARLWGVPRPDGDVVDIILPARSRQANLTDVAVHRPRDLRDLTPSRRAHIATTNILRTLCDLGAVDEGAVPGAVGHVVTTGLASPDALQAAIRRHSRRGRPGVPALRDALDEWVIDDKPVDSVLEPAMRRLLATHALPPADFHPTIGGYEVDFLVRDSTIVLECDGWSTHGLDQRTFELDRHRDADLSALGYVVLRFTYRDITRRQRRVAERIRTNVARWAPHLLGSGRPP
ncbi:MAG: type IV toxin-antitoxin system AbiEi family antitoxin domain-containing protein [Ilumatobacteraceae bacterium]